MYTTFIPVIGFYLTCFVCILHLHCIVHIMTKKILITAVLSTFRKLNLSHLQMQLLQYSAFYAVKI